MKLIANAIVQFEHDWIILNLKKTFVNILIICYVWCCCLHSFMFLYSLSLVALSKCSGSRALLLSLGYDGFLTVFDIRCCCTINAYFSYIQWCHHAIKALIKDLAMHVDQSTVQAINFYIQFGKESKTDKFSFSFRCLTVMFECFW